METIGTSVELTVPKTFQQFAEEHGGFKADILQPVDIEKRVIDMFPNKNAILPHLQNFMQHCMARKVNPTLEVILDWLYSNKNALDRDDFVSIERCKEMVMEGNSFPNIIVEVLEYASAVEKAAKALASDMHGITGLKSLDELNDALAHRKVKRNDDNDPITIEI